MHSKVCKHSKQLPPPSVVNHNVNKRRWGWADICSPPKHMILILKMASPIGIKKGGTPLEFGRHVNILA